MRALTALALLSSLPALAHAEDDLGPADRSGTPVVKATDVVGGTNAPLGKWPDAAAILFGNSPGCTGTLIAPTVALTAGHCEEDSLNNILVGTNALDRAADGEILSVVRRVVLDQADITVLVLGNPSRFAPRALATGWAQLDIKNGAPVAIVGYGAIDRNASEYVNALQEATSTITDFDCSVMPGCADFELGAGGNGIDSCNGDSGGPLYLQTSYGDFLIGVTSRAYQGANDPCGEGGIYGRPDLLVDQIEAAAGTQVTRGPEPTAERIVAIRGDAGETQVIANDPKGTAHTFELATPPARARAAVRADGAVRVCLNADAIPGDSDSLSVKVTDTADPTRSVTTKIQIAVAQNEPVSGDCDPEAFETPDGEDGGGCCQSSRGAEGALPLSLFVLLVLRRRRR